jgi:hypothetical protein
MAAEMTKEMVDDGCGVGMSEFGMHRFQGLGDCVVVGWFPETAFHDHNVGIASVVMVSPSYLCWRKFST